MNIRLSLVVAVTIAATLAACKKKEDEPPPPLPTAPTDTAPAPPPSMVAPPPTTVSLAPAAPLPGTSPSTLSEAILVTKPAMADTTGAPDEGSNALMKYWRDKKYSWAQLEAVPEVQAAAFLANPAAGRGSRVCGTGVVGQFAKVSTTPPDQYEGTLQTATGEVLSYGALGDAAGIAPNAPGKRICGVASGVQTMTAPDGKQIRAIRITGYFDTPGNRGGGTGGFGNLKACCQALIQNAASMPPPQNMYAAAAGQYCMATVASVSSPQQKDALLAGIRGALKGAPMPGMCR